jgi:DNA-binding FadR family transcriptional regulator
MSNNRNRVDAVYTGILNTIADGDYPSTGRLPSETELAMTYGVSRPTVREALSRLRLDRLITSQRGSGSYVIKRMDRNIRRFAAIESIADVQRCFIFRIAIESAAAGLAADSTDTRAIQDIVQCFEEMEEARIKNDNALFVEADLRFHLAIAHASQNVFFYTSLEQILAQVRVGMKLALNLSMEHERAWREIVQAEHREIVRAIEKGSSADADDAMRSHLASARRRLFEGPDG